MHEGLSACRKLLLPPQEVQKAQRGDAQLGSPRYSKPHLPAFTRFAPLSSFKSAAGERRSSAACYFSACLAPKTAWRRAPFNHLPRNLPPSSLLSAEGLGRPEPSQVPSEPRCLPALWLPPRPLLQPLQSWDVRAMKSKMLRSRGNNSAGVIGDMSSALFLLELSAPAWPDVPRRAALTREERLELGEHSQARQTCFLKAASKARSVRAD